MRTNAETKFITVLAGSGLSSFQAVVWLILNGICFDYAWRVVCDTNRCWSQDMAWERKVCLKDGWRCSCSKQY